MKNFTKTILTTASAALISGAAFAGSHMAMEMTIVSWGGAYSKSQLKAYHEPCLLYTSPSPRDKRQSRMPSSA